jgi:N-acetylmuramoyl-L-alanine amidase
MKNRDWLIGILSRQGYLKKEGEEILLTKLPKEAAESPESVPLDIPEENTGKTALVRGHLVGNFLHSAQVVEVLPWLAGALIHRLAEKGIVTLSEIQDHLSDLEEQQEEPSKRLCALVIGHKRTSSGATNPSTGLSEFDFNENLAFRIEEKVRETSVQRVYRRTWEQLPADINALSPDSVVSLHCNAFNTQVSGTEVLYYHRSEKGKKMAEILLDRLVGHLRLSNRGIKPKTSEDRGGYLLRYADAPSVIAEPFFIDNDGDLAKAQDDTEGLATAYAVAIDQISGVVV